MASSALLPSQHPQQDPPNDFTPYHVLMVLRFAQLTCRGLYNGTTPADHFATNILPQMLPTLHALLRRSGKEITFNENLIVEIVQDIKKRKGCGAHDDNENEKIVGVATGRIGKHLRDLELEFRYIRQFVEYVEGVMKKLGDAIVGVEEQMLWEDIERYFEDVNESIEERMRKMDDCRGQLLEEAR